LPPRALALAAAACKGDGVGEIEKIGLAAGREERRPGDIGLPKANTIGPESYDVIPC